MLPQQIFELVFAVAQRQFEIVQAADFDGVFVGKFLGIVEFSRERVASLRLVSSGGAGVTPSFVVQASEELGARVKRSYGSTEAPTITSSTQSGGSIGATSSATLDDCAARIDAIAEAGRSVREDIILLCHGGPIAQPGDAQFILNRCPACHGRSPKDVRD